MSSNITDDKGALHEFGGERSKKMREEWKGRRKGKRSKRGRTK